jgi:dephospho-CoA kinase
MRIAITGGIAEGKSTVLKGLAEAGYLIASSDTIAREVWERPVVQAEVAALLGTPHVSREAVRLAVATDPGFRRRLNRITHPRIIAELLATPAQFYEIPLLCETCVQSAFDRVWVVTCGLGTQLQRLAERLGSEVEARLFLQTQLSSEVKLAFADLVVRTNQPPEAVNAFVIRRASREFV